jgi:aryl-alcohol dehydrogenase-like predicted oxidoreductase
MQYRSLGQTGISISEIGFGAWGIGGPTETSPAYGLTDDHESRKALRFSYESGITFYDTADFYGQGHSEKLIGETLRDVRKNIVIATKVGLLSTSGKQNFSPKHIKKSLEDSLNRLKTDYIDVYQLHNPPLEILKNSDEIMYTLQAMKTEGKIRAIGVSIRSPDDGLEMVEYAILESIQVNFNLLDQRALENKLFEICEAKGMGIIVRTPLCFGFLTGEYSHQIQFGHDDHRSRWSPEQLRRWANAYNDFSDMSDRTQPHTPAQTAIRFCLSYSCVSTVIPGMLTEAHVSENIAASDLGVFDEQKLQLAEQIYRDQSFFLDK